MVTQLVLSASNHQMNNLQVNDQNLLVKNSAGKIIESQYVELDNVTSNLRSFYVKAHIGIASKKAPQFWLFFQASVPPLGWNTFFISKASWRGTSPTFFLNNIPFL